MTVVLDTSVLAAALNEQDPRHRGARALLSRILKGEFGKPITSEHVLDEGLTLLRKRPGRKDASARFAAFMFGDETGRAPVHLTTTTREDLWRARDLHFQQYERKLSFTDCVLVELAREHGAVIASYDQGFDGLVARVE